VRRSGVAIMVASCLQKTSFHLSNRYFALRWRQ